MPRPRDFLNNFPLASYVKPCNGDFCTIAKYKRIRLENDPSNPFVPNEKVTKVLGPAADNNCVVLI